MLSCQDVILDTFDISAEFPVVSPATLEVTAVRSLWNPYLIETSSFRFCSLPCGFWNCFGCENKFGGPLDLPGLLVEVWDVNNVSYRGLELS